MEIFCKILYLTLDWKEIYKLEKIPLTLDILKASKELHD